MRFGRVAYPVFGHAAYVRAVEAHTHAQAVPRPLLTTGGPEDVSVVQVGTSGGAHLCVVVEPGGVTAPVGLGTTGKVRAALSSPWAGMIVDQASGLSAATARQRQTANARLDVDDDLAAAFVGLVPIPRLRGPCMQVPTAKWRTEAVASVPPVVVPRAKPMPNPFDVGEPAMVVPPDPSSEPMVTTDQVIAEDISLCPLSGDHLVPTPLLMCRLPDGGKTARLLRGIGEARKGAGAAASVLAQVGATTADRIETLSVHAMSAMRTVWGNHKRLAERPATAVARCEEEAGLGLIPVPAILEHDLFRQQHAAALPPRLALPMSETREPVAFTANEGVFAHFFASVFLPPPVGTRVRPLQVPFLSQMRPLAPSADIIPAKPVWTATVATARLPTPPPTLGGPAWSGIHRSWVPTAVRLAHQHAALAAGARSQTDDESMAPAASFDREPLTIIDDPTWTSPTTLAVSRQRNRHLSVVANTDGIDRGDQQHLLTGDRLLLPAPFPSSAKPAVATATRSRGSSDLASFMALRNASTSNPAATPPVTEQTGTFFFFFLCVCVCVCLNVCLFVLYALVQ